MEAHTGDESWRELMAGALGLRGVLVLLVTALVIKVLRMGPRLPPGPWNLPVVGQIPFVSKDIHVYLLKLAQRFGDIYHIKFGNKVWIILTDAKVIREAFKREEFTARPSSTFDLFQGYGESS